ncbi:MAG: hypothetical protein NC181_03685 [Clostridium sp.]|nr:hypothetical protein [Clostridium sp.]MCM1444278.1 hypothetical protein [Candidatus Amulumruptor caecigallinarius]
MILDDIDKALLKENFDDDTINKIDINNLTLIYNYLIRNGVYYVNDLIISSLDLFLLPYELFVKKFEKLKNELGENYIEKLGEDSSLIEIMYNE